MTSDYKKEYKELVRKIVLKQDILKALAYVGICKGQTVMVHTSLSSLGFGLRRCAGDDRGAFGSSWR